MTPQEQEQPLVSITIPTFNNAATLDETLRAVEAQTYRSIEVNIVDSHSSDTTVTIAQRHGARIITIDGKLLQAREVGARAANGEFVLLLDSDQILDPTAIERAIRLVRQGPFDMLFFEEHSYHPRHWLQRLFELDRRAIQKTADMDAETGVMLPRFFRREILLRAFDAIPVDELADVVAQDHAIIHWEASKLSRRTAVVADAVYHMDPDDLLRLLRHFYRKGRAARNLDHNQVYVRRYKGMFGAKSRSRGLIAGSFTIESNLVLLLKGVPYFVGKWLG